MENLFGIILVIVFLLIVAGPMLSRFFGPMLQRWLMGKMEDRMRRMAGMPTRKEERRARRRERSRRASGASRFARAAAGRRATASDDFERRRASAADALRSYAEDVEFIEVKSYSEEVTISASHTKDSKKFKIEEQVEDADFELISRND